MKTYDNAPSRRRWIPRLTLVLIVGLAGTEAPSQGKGEPKPKELRVLFVGNSLTYFNDLPRMVEALAESAPKDQPRIKASYATSAGCMLEGHLPANRMGTQKYDAVVLQEGIYGSPDGFDTYAANFNKYAPLCHEQIEKNGSKTALFCTASINRLYPKAFQEMHDLQVAMGKKLKVPVAAGGKAWLSYWGDEPTPEQRLALYDPDKTHPSNKGSYLYACSLYAVLTGYTPVGLTNRLPKQPEDTITPAEAKKMQEAAWKVHREINAKEKAPTSGRGDEPLKDTAKKGPLADLPSKPGAHLDKIKALGDNQWVNLGAPAADPKWGKARGRSWGAKALILAPDLRGAFLFGEGVHGYVKPDGHAMDDLWFYDINAHAWICLYPGMNTKTFTQRVKDKELKIDDNGLFRDKDGQAIPVHTLVHAWGYLTYDSERKKFAFISWNTGDEIPRYYLGGVKQMEEGLKLLEEQRKGKQKPAFSPWYYDVASGQFERSPATGSMGGCAGAFPQLHYLSAQKQFFAVGSNGVAIFDPAKSQWSEAKPKGPAPKGSDGCGCYDSKRNRVYRNDGDGSKGEGLMAYDIGSNTWSHLKPKGNGPETMNTNRGYYEYDPLLDLVVVFQMGLKAPGVFTYDPQTNAWADPLPFPADGPKLQNAVNTCYDRELNVYLCHVAGDSDDNGVVWAYRYKKRN